MGGLAVNMKSESHRLTACNHADIRIKEDETQKIF